MIPKLPPLTFDDVDVLPPVHNRNNIYDGGTPHVALAVEDIAEYFTKEDWQQRVSTIRTIGRIRRLENENYIIESVNEWVEFAQVPLSRGTNRELRQVSQNRKRIKEIVGNRDKKYEKDSDYGKALRGAESHKNDKPGAPSKVKGFPFPDSVKNPDYLGDTRVKDGAPYMVLGKLKWFNDQPIIDVDRFIPIHDLRSSYQAFSLQHTIARREIDFFKAHPEELRGIERRPDEILEPVFKVPKLQGNTLKRKRAK